MKAIRNLLKKQSMNENILAVLLFVFIVFRISVPDALTPMIASVPGTVIVVLAAVSLFFFTNPIIAILGLIAAYEIISRSGGSLSPSAANFNTPSLQQSESRKKQYMNTINGFPVTLEESIVKNMVPLVSSEPIISSLNYKPVLDPVTGATPI